jgi:hypothetical protein
MTAEHDHARPLKESLLASDSAGSPDLGREIAVIVERRFVGDEEVTV